MFCMKCGTDLPDNSRFCRTCGQTLDPVSTGGGAAAAPARITPRESKPPKSSIAWSVVGVIVLLVLGVSWYAQNAKTRPLPLPEQSARTQQPQLHTTATGDKAFTVAAGSVFYFKLPVPAGAYDVNLKGHFSATGGSGNDIDVLVITEDDYVNWNNGHTVHALYNSGQITQETLTVPLPRDAATYYLVFNNKFSLLTPKAVQVNAALTYYTR
jgi:hypothetical protein